MKKQKIKVSINFHIDSLSGQPQLFPGTNDFEESVMETIALAINDRDEEALKWLYNNVYKID